MDKVLRLHLFQGYGVELEYMIVDRELLDIRPVADQILVDETGEVNGELEKGSIGWSNELVNHVIELKSNGPAANLSALRDDFVKNVREVNKQLKPLNSCLMPTAAHPWMNPTKETQLWSYENNEIYEAYNRIFGCKGHGWSNLQSVHLNLPFYDDEEFAKLHSAIRFILPLLPAMAASSPILDGKWTGYMDKRLYYYEKNQSNIPAITGKVIPERVFTRHGYQKRIFDRISVAIKPFDPQDLLKPVWLNSRGAIARFDRGTIEIRIIDIQECPSSDLALIALIVHLLKSLVKGKWIKLENQQKFEAEDLHPIFREVIKTGSATLIEDRGYLEVWGIKEPLYANELWKVILDRVEEEYPSEMDPWMKILRGINEQGTLAERIVRKLGADWQKTHLTDLYRELSICLENDQPYLL